MMHTNEVHRLLHLRTRYEKGLEVGSMRNEN